MNAIGDYTNKKKKYHGITIYHGVFKAHFDTKVVKPSFYLTFPHPSDADWQLSDADDLMASSSEVNVHMEEVVVVTTPDTTGQTSSSDEEKNILVATDLEQSG